QRADQAGTRRAGEDVPEGERPAAGGRAAVLAAGGQRGARRVAAQGHPGRGDGRNRPAGDVPARRAGRRVVRAEDAAEPRTPGEGDEMTVPPPADARPVRPLVTIRDLRVELGGRVILDRVSADLARGKITALIGLNGSGKTTLLRAMVR